MAEEPVRPTRYRRRTRQADDARRPALVERRDHPPRAQRRGRREGASAARSRHERPVEEPDLERAGDQKGRMEEHHPPIVLRRRLDAPAGEESAEVPVRDAQLDEPAGGDYSDEDGVRGRGCLGRGALAYGDSSGGGPKKEGVHAQGTAKCRERACPVAPPPRNGPRKAEVTRSSLSTPRIEQGMPRSLLETVHFVRGMQRVDPEVEAPRARDAPFPSHDSPECWLNVATTLRMNSERGKTAPP